MPPIPNPQINQMSGLKPQPVGNKARTNPSATPAVSYTPSDVVIPTNLYDKIPDLEQYKRLKEAERRIDLLVSKKSLDFQAIQSKALQPSNLGREKGILRVFIYNTCENQPWQRSLVEQNSEQGNSTESTWTLRVEGKLLLDNNEGNTVTSSKLSSFLSGVSIDIIPNDDYPNLQNATNNIIEWKDNVQGAQNGAQQIEFDGIDVKRQGTFDIDTKIALMVKTDGNIIHLDEKLSQFLGKQEATLQELIFSIWQYVLYKDLLKKDDITNVPVLSSTSTSDAQSTFEHELSVVNADDVLINLLGVQTFKFTDLYKLLQPHFRPREPIVIDYKVNTRKSSTLGDIVLDIPVALPPSIAKVQNELLNFSKSTFEDLSKSDATIHQLNHRISLGIVALQHANRRERFYSQLSKDPVKFMNKWIESQSNTLKALKCDEAYDEETVRRAQFFQENEDMLKEKIDLLLGSTRF